MSVPPIPPPLAQLGRRRFSFYPAIVNIKHNEWVYQSATWADVLVRNTKTNEELAVPRRYLGEISSVEAPVMIVGLLKELEYRAGAVWPAQRRVIEMPRAVNDSPRARPADSPHAPAPVIGIRLESPARSRLGKVAIAGVAIGLSGCVLAISLFRGGVLASRAFYSPALQSAAVLTPQDDYSAVVRKLGKPARERWRVSALNAMPDRAFHEKPDGSARREYCLLVYPQRGVYIILMGRDRSDMRYIGALDRRWNAVNTVELPGYGNTRDLLEHLPQF